MPFSDEELALTATIRADPKNIAALLSYSEWLADNGEPELAESIRLAAGDEWPIHREAMQYGFYVGQGPEPERTNRTRIGCLIAENMKTWTANLPPGVKPNRAVHTGLCALRGMPLINIPYRRGTSAEQLNERSRMLSPRLLMELEIHIHPGSLQPEDRERWWGRSLAEIQPALIRASRLVLIFRDPDMVSESGRLLRLGPALRMKPVMAFVHELGELLDVRRTPWVCFYESSTAARNLAIKLFADRLDLSFVG